MLICISTALIKSLLLKMPIKQFFSWFQIMASATSTHNTELSSSTLRAKTIKCQTDGHVRVEHGHLSTARKSIIRRMRLEEVDNSVDNVVLLPGDITLRRDPENPRSCSFSTIGFFPGKILFRQSPKRWRYSQFYIISAIRCHRRRGILTTLFTWFRRRGHYKRNRYLTIR